MKLTITRWDTGDTIYEAEAAGIGELLHAAVADHVNLYGASLDRASLDGASLVGARLDRASLDRASLDGARLDRASLDRASLDGASLVGARLDGASLVGASLVGARLVGARLDGASLDGARLDGARLVGASLVGASLVGARLVGARLDGASLDGARLDGARLVGARLVGDTIIETGERWGDYIRQVLPALLTSGGRALAEMLQPAHWECHSWDNCPMAAAFSAKGIDGVPLLLKPRAEQFIRYFDARLLTLETVLKGSAPQVDSANLPPLA